MKAEAVFREKRAVLNPKTGQLGKAEIRIWKVSRSEHHPEGRKFSLYLACEGRVLIGIDNHRPKGPHLHSGDEEVPFNYGGDEQLLNEFWELVRKAGFEP